MTVINCFYCFYFLLVLRVLVQMRSVISVFNKRIWMNNEAAAQSSRVLWARGSCSDCHWTLDHWLIFCICNCCRCPCHATNYSNLFHTKLQKELLLPPETFFFKVQNAPYTVWRPGSTRTRWGPYTAPEKRAGGEKKRGIKGKGKEERKSLHHSIQPRAHQTNLIRHRLSICTLWEFCSLRSSRRADLFDRCDTQNTRETSK